MGRFETQARDFFSTLLRRHGKLECKHPGKQKNRTLTMTSQATGLPSGWVSVEHLLHCYSLLTSQSQEVRHSNSKNLPYYFNPNTKESRWEPPQETDSDTLKHYMGQYHTANLGHNGVANQNLDGKIRAAHLLVKHRDSRRPSSWREAEITRTRDDAMGIIQGHEQRIKSGSTSLGDLATTESDCSSARKRGDL